MKLLLKSYCMTLKGAEQPRFFEAPLISFTTASGLAVAVGISFTE